MEALLKQEMAHVRKLEKMLEEERESKNALIQQHRQEIDELHRTLIAQSKEQMQQGLKGSVEQMKLEIERVQREADELLKKEKAKNKRLEKEKDEWKQTVEKEKVKMRKLVKVLAVREREELQLHQNVERGSASTTVSVNGSSGGRIAPNVATARGSRPK
mmetsp:Transcript_2456/g.3705  ORF Transcript_2456/g.3705 Transcript_2456/m.3705 type:complete len:160 (-) Transcript_2456:8-487(-)